MPDLMLRHSDNITGWLTVQKMRLGLETSRRRGYGGYIVKPNSPLNYADNPLALTNVSLVLLLIPKIRLFTRLLCYSILKGLFTPSGGGACNVASGDAWGWYYGEGEQHKELNETDSTRMLRSTEHRGGVDMNVYNIILGDTKHEGDLHIAVEITMWGCYRAGGNLSVKFRGSVIKTFVQHFVFFLFSFLIY